MSVQISTDLFISVHNPKPNEIKILSQGVVLTMRPLIWIIASRGLNMGGSIKEVTEFICAMLSVCYVCSVLYVCTVGSVCSSFCLLATKPNACADA